MGILHFNWIKDGRSVVHDVVPVYVPGLAPGQANDYNAIGRYELEKQCLVGWCMGPIGLDFRQENISIETKNQQMFVFEVQVC